MDPICSVKPDTDAEESFKNLGVRTQILCFLRDRSGCELERLCCTMLYQSFRKINTKKTPLSQVPNPGSTQRPPPLGFAAPRRRVLFPASGQAPLGAPSVVDRGRLRRQSEWGVFDRWRWLRRSPGSLRPMCIMQLDPRRVRWTCVLYSLNSLHILYPKNTYGLTMAGVGPTFAGVPALKTLICCTQKDRSLFWRSLGSQIPGLEGPVGLFGAGYTWYTLKSL